MHLPKWKQIFSWVLLTGGFCLLILGAYEGFWGRITQFSVAAAWDRPFSESYSPSKFDNPSEIIPEGQAIAKLSFPRLKAEWYVVEGIEKEDLLRGPGHLPGTAMPGAQGNCVIAGHRDTHFRVLKDIKNGDELLLEAGGMQYRYRVSNVSIVWPTNTRPLDPTRTAVLNLITCYPFYYIGAAPKRYIVKADLVETRSLTPKVSRLS